MDDALRNKPHGQARIVIVRRGRPRRKDHSATERRLLAMLFVDIVGSTRVAAELGDEQWSGLLGEFRRLTDAALHAHEGRRIKWTGDGFLATFVRPADAVRCGLRLTEDSTRVGVEVRCGVHTGEVVWEGSHPAGVHAAARIMAEARPSEVLVSRTTVEVTAGTELSYRPRGAHVLAGVPGEWVLFFAGVEPPRRWSAAPSLVEREEEVAVLHEHLDRAIQGRGSVVTG